MAHENRDDLLDKLAFYKQNYPELVAAAESFVSGLDEAGVGAEIKERAGQISEVQRAALSRTESGKKRVISQTTGIKEAELESADWFLKKADPKDLVSAFGSLVEPTDTGKRTAFQDNFGKAIKAAGLDDFKSAYNNFREMASMRIGNWRAAHSRAFMELCRFQKELEYMLEYGKGENPASKAVTFTNSWLKRVNECLDQMKPKTDKSLVKLDSAISAILMPITLPAKEVEKAAEEKPVEPVTVVVETSVAVVAPSLSEQRDEAKLVLERPDLSDVRAALAEFPANPEDRRRGDLLDDWLDYYFADFEQKRESSLAGARAVLEREILGSFATISRVCADLENGGKAKTGDVTEIHIFTIRANKMLDTMYHAASEADATTTRESFNEENTPKAVLALLSIIDRMQKIAKQSLSQDR